MDLPESMINSKKFAPTPVLPPRNYEEDENCAAEGLLLLGLSRGGFCVSSSETSSPSSAEINGQNKPVAAVTDFSNVVDVKQQKSPLATTASDTIKKVEDSSPENSPHKCDVCGKTFRSHQALGGHKTAHRPKPTTTAAATHVNNGRVFECEICHKCFPSGAALGGHKRKHYEGKIERAINKSSKISPNGSPSAERNGVSSDDVASAHAPHPDFDLNLHP